jgi:hypothetical protein
MYIIGIYKKDKWGTQPTSIVFNVTADFEEVVDNFIEIYSNIDSFTTVFSQLISTLTPSETSIRGYENLGSEDIKLKLMELQKRCVDLESVKSNLEHELLELSESKLKLDKESLKQEIHNIKQEKRKIEQTVKDQEFKIKQLTRELEQYKSSSQKSSNEKYSLQDELRKFQQEYQKRENEWSRWFGQYQELERQVARVPSLNQENERLRKYRQDLEAQVFTMEKELEEAQKKLSLAMTRLQEKTVKPGIAGGSSRSDQLRNEFANLKGGLFHQVSGKILSYWRETDSKLTFRSEEFFKIKSVLSQCVFLDGMSYFIEDKSGIDANVVELIINELLRVEGLNLTSSISQVIEQRINTVLSTSKGIDNSEEALTKHIETTTHRILEDLKTIRDSSISEEVLQEIKKFVEVGLRLVRDIVNDSSTGELYMPKTGDKFDENFYDTRDEPEGKVKLTICAGYLIPGTVLVKADVITYIPDETNNSPMSDAETTSDTIDIVDKSDQSESSEIQDQESTQPSEDNQEQNEIPNTQNISISPPETTSNPEYVVDETTESQLLENQDQQSIEVSEDNQKQAEENQENLSYNQTSGSQKFDVEEKIVLINFMSKVAANEGVIFRTQPSKNEQYHTNEEAPHNTILDFDAWTHSSNNELKNRDDNPDYRWYKIAGKQYWVPAACMTEHAPGSNPLPNE